MAATPAAQLFSVNNLVAVITGGGSGLGLMAAKALDANGAKAVYILGRRLQTLQSAAAQAVNGTIIPVECDVTSKDSLAAAARRVEAEVGYVNVLFANSGTSGSEQWAKFGDDESARTDAIKFQQTLWETPAETFTNTMAVNVTGMWYSALAFLPLLDAGNKKANVTQKSQVVVTASVGGFARVPIVGMDYTASKAAAIQVTKTMATAFAPFKIRANVIAPGLYPSEMSQGLAIFSGGADLTVEGSVPSTNIPIPSAAWTWADTRQLQRTGNAKDFAGVTLFMMSEAGAYLNGAQIVTDGGRLGVMPSSH